MSLSERAANWAIVMLAVVVCAVAYKVVFSRAPQPQTDYVAKRDVPFHAGEAVPAIDGLSFGDARVTALLILREDCSHCTASLPFYRPLTQERSRHDSRYIVVTTSAKDKMARYLSENRVDVDGIVTMPDLLLQKILGTPTLVLVDKAGKAVGSWAGELSVEQQREVKTHLL